MTNYPRSAYGTYNPNAGKPANGDFQAWQGYRWPNCAPASLMGTTDYTNKFGQRLRVQLRSGIVELATLMFRIADKHNYCVYSRNNGENWGPWGMDCRPISGSNSPSGHSGALAMDWNAPRNAYSTTFQSDMPPAMVADIEACGWYWGGRYTGKYDAMHFSYCWTPSDVARHVAKAKAILGGDAPPPDKPPPPEDDSMSAADVEALKKHIDQRLMDRTEGSHSVFDELRWVSDKVVTPRLDQILAAVNADTGAANTGSETYACVVDNESGAWYAVAPGHFWHIENMIEVSILRRSGVLIGETHLNHGDVVHLRTMVLRAPGAVGDVPPPATYTVKAGDTLGAIAKANNMTVAQLQQWNGIANPDNISEGQVLRLTAP